MNSDLTPAKSIKDPGNNKNIVGKPVNDQQSKVKPYNAYDSDNSL